MPLPDPKDTVKYLSIKYSMPEWIVNLWLPAYGTRRNGNTFKRTPFHSSGISAVLPRN